MSEQRYQAVLAVIKDGVTVTEVAARLGVSRKTVHLWLARYNGYRKPTSVEAEAAVLLAVPLVQFFTARLIVQPAS